jgi:hypothetical protein
VAIWITASMSSLLGGNDGAGDEFLTDDEPEES